VARPMAGRLAAGRLAGRFLARPGRRGPWLAGSGRPGHRHGW
jgi:hypothetical protein